MLKIIILDEYAAASWHLAPKLQHCDAVKHVFFLFLPKEEEVRGGMEKAGNLRRELVKAERAES